MSWMPVTTMRVPVAVEPHRRVRRRAAAAPPDLRGTAHAAEQAVRLRLAQRVAAAPAGELGGAVVAPEQLLARVRQPARLVDVDVVPAPELERIHVERQRELVHRLLEARRCPP